MSKVPETHHLINSVWYYRRRVPEHLAFSSVSFMN
jgi:hypothetical protein